jgi:hypothetical protein
MRTVCQVDTDKWFVCIKIEAHIGSNAARVVAPVLRMGGKLVSEWGSRTISMVSQLGGHQRTLIDRGHSVAKAKTKKIVMGISARLCEKLLKVVEQSGQSRQLLIERAVEHYLESVVPSKNTVRPEVIEHFRRSTKKIRKLHQLLAQ